MSQSTSKLAARILERHAPVHGLIEQDHSMARIARELGLDPRTVRRFATAEHAARELLARGWRGGIAPSTTSARNSSLDHER